MTVIQSLQFFIMQVFCVPRLNYKIGNYLQISSFETTNYCM